MSKIKDKLKMLEEEKKKLEEIKRRHGVVTTETRKEKKKKQQNKDKRKKKKERKNKTETKERKQQELTLFEKLKTKKKKDEKKGKSSYEQIKFFSDFISKSGFNAGFFQINKIIMIITLTPIVVGGFYFFIDALLKKAFIGDTVMFLLSFIIFGSLGLYLVCWLGFFVYVDTKIYQRKKEIEKVFPDFLQLTAANINAGMPIDRALWFAIRPRFGILAKEMEDVAKATIVGEKLGSALEEFAKKYESMTVKRSINLILEGIKSGGEIGELLTKVSSNIRETQIIKKEMAANVTTYVIFILFATLVAAPFMFGLTTELIVIMKSIMADVNIDASGGGAGGMSSMMSLSGSDSISVTNYKIFAVVSICITTTFSAILISIIKKGNAKEALKNIPIYMGVGVVLYFIAFSLMNMLLGGFFS